MSTPVIVTDRETLTSTVEDVVSRVLLERVPDAIREATKPEWMDKHTVEEGYGLTSRQLTYIRNQGTVEFTQHGRRILYNVRSLERWIDEGRVRPKAERTNGNGRGNP